MSRVFNRATNWIVQYPLLTTLLIGVVSAIATVGYVDHTLVTRWFDDEAEATSTEGTTQDEFDEEPPVGGFSFLPNR